MSATQHPDEILKKHWLKKGSVRVGNIIASGAYGRVYQGWYGSLKVAIKDYGVIYDELDTDDKMDIMEEFQLMKDLNHTNTVRVYGFILNRGCLALVMEYATRGSLKRFIQKTYQFVFKYPWTNLLEQTNHFTGIKICIDHLQ